MFNRDVMVSKDVLEDGLGNKIRHRHKLFYYVNFWFRIAIAVLSTNQDPKMKVIGIQW